MPNIAIHYEREESGHRFFDHNDVRVGYDRDRGVLYICALRDDIEEWMEENIRGNYAVLPVGENEEHHIVYFELEADAVAFKLRWL